MFGIDIVAPKHFGSSPIDLVVSGPNEGQNNGPFLYTLSGTIGATYTAVERGVRSIPVVIEIEDKQLTHGPHG